MSRKIGKKRHTLLIVIGILLAVLATAALILMTHTQIIVGTIQKLSANTVNTINSYEPLGEPMEGVKDNAKLLSGKKVAYAEYRKLRDEAQELVIAENNLKSLFAAVGSEVQHQQGQREEAAKQI